MCANFELSIGHPQAPLGIDFESSSSSAHGASADYFNRNGIRIGLAGIGAGA